MATFDDFDGVWFTIQALRMGHPDLADRLSFVVIDNHPEGPAAAALQSLESQIPRFRYIPFTGFRGTAVRDLVFRETDADVVCCVDSHVLVRPGDLGALLGWFDAHPDSRDLLQGPLWYDALGDNVSTHFAPRWGGGMYGQWDVAEAGIDPSAPPFEIPMQGLGLFACRRDAWPGLNPRFRGFGGEEGYLHEKFRQNGGRVLCHPSVRWAHRFQRPMGVPYTNVWEDRVRNYLFGWTELGLDTVEIEAHFREHIGNDEATTTLLGRAWRQVSSPFSTFDALYFRAGEASEVLPAADVAWRMEEIPVSAITSELPAQAQALRWRWVLAESQRRGYAQILVVEEPCDVDEEELRRFDVGAQAWDVLHLVDGTDDGAATPGPAATAVRAAAYSTLLAHLPEDVEQADEFIATWGSWSAYLAHCCACSLHRLDVAVVLSPTADGDAQRPCRTVGLQIREVADGLMVTNPHTGTTCHLNQTAALVLQLSCGLLTARQIAGVLADEFCLPHAPIVEVNEAVATLRELRVVA